MQNKESQSASIPKFYYGKCIKSILKVILLEYKCGDEFSMSEMKNKINENERNIFHYLDRLIDEGILEKRFSLEKEKYTWKILSLKKAKDFLMEKVILKPKAFLGTFSINHDESNS